MGLSVETAGNSGVYFLWLGCLLAAFDLYPNRWFWVYILFAVIVTGVILFVMLMFSNRWEDIEGNSELEEEYQEIIESIHLPCGRPQTCERCAGFYWGFATAIGLSVILSVLIGQQGPVDQFGPEIAWGSFALFILFISGHGLLNAAIKLGYVESLEYLTGGRMKLAAGFFGGLSLIMMGVGIIITYT